MTRSAQQDFGEIRYAMTLYITGATPRSLMAVSNLQAFCEQELAERYDLEIVDLYQSPERAVAAQIVAVPTLIRHVPLPARRVIGDMSDRMRLRTAVKVV